MKKLRDKYFGDVLGRPIEKTQPTKVVLGFDNVLFPFLIIGIGIPLTLILLVCEVLKNCFHVKKV